ncbi:hypothetical protein HZ326_23067 [Fusarium oxysporum f. sp. albedinis]|nr:hypothetical protein HZ326_23067 [Fusarium oxysporum f. sp. albedinis]
MNREIAPETLLRFASMSAFFFFLISINRATSSGANFFIVLRGRGAGLGIPTCPTTLGASCMPLRRRFFLIGRAHVASQDARCMPLKLEANSPISIAGRSKSLRDGRWVSEGGTRY